MRSRAVSMLARWVMLWLSLALVTSCRTGEGQSALPPAFVNPPRRPQLPLVLVLAPVAQATDLIVRVLRSELNDTIDVMALAVDRDETSPRRVREWLQEHAPKAVVLLDNPTVEAFRGAVAGMPPEAVPLAVLGMTSFAEHLQRGLPKVTGVAFEVPAITGLAGLRALTRGPVAKVGVPCRRAFLPWVEHQAELARREEITLVPYAIEETSVRELRAMLRQAAADGVNALWLMNDNALFTPEAQREAWLPFVEQESIPIVVGVPSLVDVDHHFATYAVVPDLEAMSVQLADQILSAERADWEAPEGVQPPVSVLSYLDVRLLDRLGARQRAVERVDVRVE